MKTLKLRSTVDSFQLTLEYLFFIHIILVYFRAILVPLKIENKNDHGLVFV